MPKKKWKVEILRLDERGLGPFEYEVNAYTADGAINDAGSTFRNKFGFFPPDNCFDVKESV